jgi:hypothetical protein
MQNALYLVQRWCEQVGLSVNPNKTTAILFTKNRNLDGFIKTRLFGIELEMQTQVKYLGVIHICYVKRPLRYGTVGVRSERLGGCDQLLCVTGSMQSSPTLALETLLMLPPLCIFIEMESRQAIYRLKCIGRFEQARVVIQKSLRR